MKHGVLLLAAFLAQTHAISFASEPKAPLVPAADSRETRANYSVTFNKEDWVNIFVGHYGEILHLYSDWTAEAVMHGPMEVVRIHGKKVDNNKLDSPPFEPEAKDYIPENFTRLRLMQLLIIPKNVPGGYRNLKDLREAKTAELIASNLGFKLEQAGGYPWPDETFRVSISTPYRLFQLYTQDDNHFYIATTGLNPEDPVLTSASEKLTNDLSTHLYSGYFEHRIEENILRESLSRVLSPWGATCTLGALLWLFPARRDRLHRLRLFGKMTFGFSMASHLIALPLLFFSWRLGLDRVVNDGSIPLGIALLMPGLCWFASTRMGGERPRRVVIASALANIIPAIVGYAYWSQFMGGKITITGTSNFWWLSLTLSTAAILNALAFGLAHSGAKTPAGDAI